MSGYLGPWKLVPGVPEGTCPECAVKHDPAQPHNKQSLAYQYKFYDANGRWPTWLDAMAHCSTEVQQAWKTELAKFGVFSAEESAAPKQ